MASETPRLSAVLEPQDARRMGLSKTVATGLIVVAAFFLGFGVWAATAPLDSAAVAPGVVAVDTQRKTVKHLEGGIVGEILVREGMEVEAEQVLIRLDRTRPLAVLEQLRSAQQGAEALTARLRAERDGAEDIAFPAGLAGTSDGRASQLMATQASVFEARRKAHAGQAAILEQQIAQSEEQAVGLRHEITSADRQLALLAEEIEDMEALLAKGLVSKPRVLALKRRRAELQGTRGRNEAAIAEAHQRIGEARVRIAELETARLNEAVDELQGVEARIFDLEERIRAAEDVLARTEIRASLRGKVVALKIHTTGGVVSPGEALLDIVPSDEAVLVDAWIDPGDIEVVWPGMTAEVRLTAFQQRHMLPLEGRLVSLSADTLTDERSGESYYLGRVALTEETAAQVDGVDIVPGMRAEVLILTGSRTVLDYLAEPLTRSFRRAFRES